MTAFGNTGSLPLAIVGSVCHDEDNMFGPDCKKKGVAYVSFAQCVSVILVYTLVYHMMEPPLEHFEIVKRGEKEEQQNSVEMSRSLVVEAEWPGIEDQESQYCKNPSIPTIEDDGDLGVDGNESSQEAVGCFAVRKMRIVAEQTSIQLILQPPTVASLLAITVGMIPQIKSFIFGYDAPLAVISDNL